MKSHRTALLFTLVLGITLSSCVRFATVRERRPIFTPVRTTVGALVSIQQRISSGMARSKHDPEAAVGDYLAAAADATERLRQDPTDVNTRNDYNFAVSRIFSIVKSSKLDPWSKPITIPAPDGGQPYVMHAPFDRSKGKNWNPALYEFTPADEFDIGGAYVKEHSKKEGFGAPLVAVGREANGDANKDFSLPRIYYGVTAIVRFKGRHAEVSFYDPLATETVTAGGRTFPLAADFTVPIAVMLASTEPEKMGLSRLIDPEKYEDTARITRLQPYDPNKTVVLVVHGLNSSPATWTPMINALRESETIRKNYQFWFYSYPSGYPYPYSASILRDQLDAIEKRFPLKKKMVVIGHSMGGCISRLLITDVGDKLWMDTFDKSPAELDIPEDSKALLEKSLVYHHRPEVGRVVFICAPLRGADLAQGWVGRLGSRLVKSPRLLARIGSEVVHAMTFQADELKLKSIPNSVDTLAPNNRFVRNINTFPLTKGIPYNTIMGDRGKGGNKDKTKPVSSDGLVPYWSSHLDGAESELIVPSNHGAHQHPATIAEVRRILVKHAGE